VYVPTERDVRPFYIDLLQNTNVRLLVYNGDADPSLSSFRTQAAWFPYLKTQQVPLHQSWRPWTLDGKSDVRGYVQEWQNNQFAFLTIRGSGHMVPEFRSEAAFAFMQSWIQGNDYPTYNPGSSRK
jgi:serine carboxypeptidase-like clade 1